LLNEDLYCHAMRAYAAMNDRTNVSRIYSELKRLLRAELNAVPMVETDKLYREMIG
jgi:DNA-binding SARP family transcriptional activator